MHKVGMPPELAEIIAVHRELFHGFVMQEGDPPEPPTPDPVSPPTPGEEALGDAGKRALSVERDARRVAEQESSELRSQIETLQGQMARLSEAFGKPADPNVDVVGQLQQEMASLRHTNLVNEVAQVHKIVDTNDIELLRGIQDRGQMEKLAARLVAAQAPPSTPPPSTPQPDPSAGRSGGKPSARSLSEAITAHYD